MKIENNDNSKKGTKPSQNDPTPAKDILVDGGQLFLDTISDLGIDYIFYNPGSDYYPILEHLSRWDKEGKERPGRILCLSEQAALGMAHGYSMRTKRAQLVLVHVGIGTLQFGGALHNVHRGRAPVLIASGRAPYTFENELLGGRDSPHHWDQEVFDQAGALREYTKWQYELKTNSNLSHIVSRAIQVANSDPQGPVYLILPRELLAEKLELQSTITNRRRILSRYQQQPAIPARCGADVDSLKRMADLLFASEYPVIITEYLGRNEEAIRSLVSISELLSIGVMELSRKRTNFPTTHANYIPTFTKEDLESADLIFLIDVDVPWIPASSFKIRNDAKTIQIDIDPIKARYPLWGFPVDVATCASSDIALAKLLSIIKEKASGIRLNKARIEDRGEKLKSRHYSIRSKLEEVARASSNKKSKNDRVAIEAMLSVVNRLKEPNSIVMNEGVSYAKMIENYVDTTIPSTFFGLGGSSLGDGISNSLGLKLASPSQDVICITGDGSFVYSNPVATLWAAVNYKLPILIVLIDNGGYIAMKRSIDKFYPEGTSMTTGHYAGVRIDPSPDYVAIAKACGCNAWGVYDQSQLEDVFTNAFRTVKEGESALVDAVVGES